MSSDLGRDGGSGALPAGKARHAPRPRLWAIVNLVVGPALFWLLASTLSVHASPPLPPAALVVPITAMVVVLALVAVLGVYTRMWRLATTAAAVYALPLTVVGLGLLIAFGLGLVALVPAASWWAVMISSSRRLSWDERESGGPSLAQRRRRALGWAWLAVASTTLPAALIVMAIARTADPRLRDGMGQVAIVLAAALVLTALACCWLLGAVLTSRWAAVGTASMVLLVLVLICTMLGVLLGLASLVLLLVPVVMVSVHVQHLRPAPDRFALA